MTDDRCPYHDQCREDLGEPCSFEAPPFAWAWCSRYAEYEYQARLARAKALRDAREKMANDAIVTGNDAIDGPIDESIEKAARETVRT